MEKECCKECFLVSHDVKMGHLDVAVPDSCKDTDCECHFKEKEAWEKNLEIDFPKGKYLDSLKVRIREIIKDERRICELTLKRTIEATRVDELSEVIKILPVSNIVDEGEYDGYNHCLADVKNKICDRLNVVTKK